MYFMYVDESGDVGMGKGSSPYFILSGLVVHESYWYDVNHRISVFRDSLYSRYGYSQGDEIHANNLLVRSNDNYRQLGKHDRLMLLRDVLKFEAALLPEIRIINVVVDKKPKSFGYDVFNTAWDTLINRFENTIRHNNFPNPYGLNISTPYSEGGFLIVDETDENKLRKLVRTMRQDKNIPSMLYPGATVQSNLKAIIEDPMQKNQSIHP